MTRAAWAWAAAASCMLVAGSGCSHPAPYAPSYGYPTYPAGPGAYPASPGGSYVVPNGSVPGSMGAPATTYPGYQGTGPTLAPPINGSGTGGSVPRTFEQSPGGAGAVPNYEDPSAGDFGGQPDDGFQPPAGNGANNSPFYQGTSLPQRLDVGQTTRPAATRPSVAQPRPDYLAGVNEYDTSSQKISPAGFDSPANEDFGFDPVTTPSAPVASQPTPQDDNGFDYERSHYGWLRGVVDFDPVRKTWHIIYGLSPDGNDKYGGSLTLADDGQLKEFQNDDVILVEGRLDPQAGRDVLGKPFYRVTRAELLGRFE